MLPSTPTPIEWKENIKKQGFQRGSMPLCFFLFLNNKMDVVRLIGRAPTEFWPHDKMTPEQQQWALLRFAVYSMTLMVLYYQSFALLVLLILVFLAMYLLVDDMVRWLFPRATRSTICIKKMDPNNPFANATVLDSVPEERLDACALDEQEAWAKKAHIESQKGRYADTFDLFDRNTMERFHSVPNQHNQDSYLSYMYPIKQTCKENNQCLVDRLNIK